MREHFFTPFLFVVKSMTDVSSVPMEPRTCRCGMKFHVAVGSQQKFHSELCKKHYLGSPAFRNETWKRQNDYYMTPQGA